MEIMGYLVFALLMLAIPLSKIEMISAYERYIENEYREDAYTTSNQIKSYFMGLKVVSLRTGSKLAVVSVIVSAVTLLFFLNTIIVNNLERLDTTLKIVVLVLIAVVHVIAFIVANYWSEDEDMSLALRAAIILSVVSIVVLVPIPLTMRLLIAQWNLWVVLLGFVISRAIDVTIILKSLGRASLLAYIPIYGNYVLVKNMRLYKE